MNKLLRSALLTIGTLAFALAAYATTPLGYVAVSASNLQNSSGVLVANATVCFAPVNNNGLPLSYRVNGTGQATQSPVCTVATNGVFSIQLADTQLTFPLNLCYAVTVTDNLTGKHLLGPGYNCVQPAGSGPAVTGGYTWCTAASGSVGGACNFDFYTPALAALMLTVPTGPPGPQGAAGPIGPAGNSGASMLPVTSTGSISVTQEWSYKLPANGQTYSTPILTTDQGQAAVAVEGWDWFYYVLQANNGSLMWRKAMNGPNYGRPQAGNVDGSGNTTFFGASHGQDATGLVTTQGALGGAIWSMNYLGANNWQVLNSFGREGTGTATSGTTTTLTDSTKSWAIGEFLSPRAAGVGYGATLNITSGAGSGETCEVASVSAHTLTCVAAMTTAPTSTSHYAVTPKYSSDEYFQHTGTLSLESGTWYLYSTGFDGEVLKLNAVTGAVVWKYEVSENMEPYPLIMNVTGNVTSGWLDVVVESVNGFVYCLNYMTGAVEWSVMPETVSATNALDGYIHAADINNSGTIQVLVGCRSSHFFIIQGSTGVVLAETSGNYGDIYAGVDNGAAIYTPIGGYSNFAFADHAGFIYDSNYQGIIQWRAYAGVTINSSIQYGDIFNNNDGSAELVIVDMAGTVTISNPATGIPYGQFQIQGGGEGTSLIGHIVDANNELVVSTLDGYIACYRIGGPVV